LVELVDSVATGGNCNIELLQFSIENVVMVHWDIRF